MFEWTVFRISEKGDGKEQKKKKNAMKYQAVQNYIYQRLSQPKINLDSINFNIYSEISFVYEDETLLCQKKLLQDLQYVPKIRQMPYNFSFEKKIRPRSKK